MIKNQFIILILAASLLCIFSCKNKNSIKVDETKKSYQNIVELIKNTQLQNDTLFKQLTNQLQDATNFQNAKHWFPRAQFTQQLTQSILKYLQNVISTDTTDTFSSIHEKVSDYKRKIEYLDENIYNTMFKDKIIITNELDSYKVTNSSNIDNDFAALPSLEKQLLLYRTYYNILLTEKEVYQYCLRSTISSQ